MRRRIFENFYIILIVLFSAKWSSPSLQVEGAQLQCYNCHGKHSDRLEDCIPSSGPTPVDRFPTKYPGSLFTSDSKAPNVCLKMVTIMQGSRPDQNLYTVIRMGANMGHLTPDQVAERLKALNDQCTLEERESANALHVSTQLCACTTDYCNGGERLQLGNKMIFVLPAVILSLIKFYIQI